MKIFNPHLPRNVTLLNLHALFMNLMFAIPVLTLFYKDHIGLGFKEFMFGEAVFSLVILLMEVPTGWISDVWTRRRVMILSSVIHVLGWLFLINAQSFAETLFAQGFLGISVSLFSGTNTAMLYDSLLESGQESESNRLEGKRHAMGLYAVAGAAVIGGLMYRIDPLLPFIATIGSSIISVVIACFLHEPKRMRAPVYKHPLADMWKTVKYALHGHAEVAGIIIAAALLFASTKIIMWMQQPYLIALGYSSVIIGIIGACGYLLGALGGHFGHKLPENISNLGVLLACTLLSFFACIVTALFPSIWMAPLLLSSSLIFGFGQPRVQNALNRRVDSSRRATILSTASLITHMISIPVMGLAGFLNDTRTPSSALLLLAGFTATAAIVILILLIKRPQKIINPHQS